METKPGKQISHYRLLEKIGEGGMGVVWKAEDTVLQRTVAIKFLPADVSRDEKRREMFLEEAKLASGVSHAHIAQVHEFSREGDLDFIVMEYVEGKALNHILHGRPLPPDKVASIGLQIAKGLSTAHRKGLLHRDLKPSNVLVTQEGDVKIVDFGLATLFERSDTSAGTDDATRTESSARRTELERSVSKEMPLAGTLPYMSPEQLKGESLDARSDIFSFGIVLYEMTTGKRPFSGATHKELAREILERTPEPVHNLVSKVPLDLDRIVQKALGKKRADRYQTIDDLAVDLKRLMKDLESGSAPSWEDLKETIAPSRRKRLLAVIGASIVIVALAALMIWWFAPNWMPGSAEKTILILPLEVQGQEEGGDFVGYSFAQALAVNLLQTKELKVLPIPEKPDSIPKASSDRIQFAQKHGIHLLMTGNLMRKEKIANASISLIDASDNRLLWVCQKEISDDNLSSLASLITTEMIQKLGISRPFVYKYWGEIWEQNEVESSPELISAIAAIRSDDIPSELKTTEQLVRIYPDNLHVQLLRAVALMDEWDFRPSDKYLKASEECLLEIKRIDPKSPYFDVEKAIILRNQGRLNDCIEKFSALLSRNDLSPELRSWFLRQRGLALADMDPQKSLPGLMEVLRLNPVHPYIYQALSRTYRLSGQYEKAIQHARQAIVLAPTDPYSYQALALAYAKIKKYEDAIPASRKACELSQSQVACAMYAIDLLNGGHLKEAESAEQHASKLTESIWGTYNLACFWAIKSNRDKAFHFLRRSIELGFASEYLERDPDFSSLKNDPEFQALCSEMKKKIGKK